MKRLIVGILTGVSILAGAYVIAPKWRSWEQDRWSLQDENITVYKFKDGINSCYVVARNMAHSQDTISCVRN